LSAYFPKNIGGAETDLCRLLHRLGYLTAFDVVVVFHDSLVVWLVELLNPGSDLLAVNLARHQHR
jgi:hypothetical protein